MDYRRTLQSGTILDGKYRIERVLGSGGFGITYEAYDLGLAASVAVKEYFPSQFGLRDATFSVRPRSDGDREMFERLRASFLREARTLNQFDHPAVVRVLNVFESHGTAYMVMKYESGPNLKVWLADLGRLPTQSELDRLTAPLLDALEMMHGAEFLHRDIAPDNIIVRADGTPVLLDFGASRRVMGEVTGTLTGVVKKGYSPQEQYATDGRAQGPWTDVYALGATLYRCISDDTPDEATDRMLDDKLLPAAEVGAGHYRPAFLAAIDAAMALRPSDRPQSISAWRGMLFDGVAVPSGNPQSWPTAARTEPTSGGASSAATIASRPARSGGKKAALAAGLVALIGGGALLAGWDPASLGETPAQSPLVDAAVTVKTDDAWRREAEEAQRRHEQQIARLTNESVERAAEEARQRKLAEEAEASRKSEDERERDAEEARRVAEEARRAAAEEAHKRQLAQETEARRKAEEAHKRAIEEAQQRAAEAARQRKLAEEAEARRLAAEQARLRQKEEIERLTREAAERASEETRRQIEEEAGQRKLAEEAEARRLAAVEAQRRQEEEIKRLTREAAERAAEATRRKIEEEARQRKLADEAAAARKAEETRSRAIADERAQEAKERTKVAALSKPPNPAPPENAFDGRWSITFTALSPTCRRQRHTYPIFIANQKVSTKRGSGQINSSGSVRWTTTPPHRPVLVDFRGTFRGNSGSGTYASRHGRCHGRFTARRG
jgi:serine/threonine protein kinase